MKLVAVLLVCLVAPVLCADICPTHLNATLTNKQSTEILYVYSYDLTHGNWEIFPPTSIAAGSEGAWKAKDACYGIEGFVTYTIGKTGYQMVCKFHNPEIGDNTYQAYINPTSTTFTASYGGGTGFDAAVTYVLNVSG
eukprot:TRINITY_DN1344_c0_g1_i2.p1 TRINITY_DN1344_c0_g1~~TRINITY_DN1344_c0_g1_i2.p1  ORF type:complete len:154 (-),score=49.89 TRINITY_DN1344_c0_g1_i2:262-675(-)